MRNLLILFIIPFLFLCKAENQSKEDSNSIFLNLGLMFQRNNRLTISGVAVKGIVKTAKVNVNPLNTDGSCNTSIVLVTGTTDASGNYSLEYNKTGGVICLTVSPDSNGNTTLFDEKVNSDVSVPASSSFKLVTVIPESKITGNSRKNMLVSPFSKLLARRLQALVKTAGSGADINALYKKASKEVVIRFGLQNGISSASGRSSVTSITSSTLSDADYPELDDIILELENPNSPLTAKFISVLVGFSQLANKYKKGSDLSVDDIDAMIEAFASDFEDGIFDGKTSNGQPIKIGFGGNQITFPSNPLTTILYPAIVSYIQEGGKLSVGKPGVASPAITVAQITSQTQFIDNATITTVTINTGTGVGTGTGTGTTTGVGTGTGILSAPTISFSGSPFSFPLNSVITAITPTVTGTITSCSISPTLPIGLTLSATCSITGTPTVLKPSTNYTITATGPTGTATAIITIGAGDLIATNLTTSLATYTAASVNDLVKVTSVEYNAVQAALSAVKSGYTGSFAADWATTIGNAQTFTYQSSFTEVNTVPIIPASSYVVAFTFHPALNPANPYSCQLKYNNNSSLTNISNLYSGATIATIDRQYFVIKSPSVQIPATLNTYLALYSSSGIGTLSTASGFNFDYVAGNQVGPQSFLSGSGVATQLPSMQVLTTLTKSW